MSPLKCVCACTVCLSLSLSQRCVALSACGAVGRGLEECPRRGRRGWHQPQQAGGGPVHVVVLPGPRTASAARRTGREGAGIRQGDMNVPVAYMTSLALHLSTHLPTSSPAHVHTPTRPLALPMCHTYRPLALPMCAHLPPSSPAHVRTPTAL